MGAQQAACLPAAHSVPPCPLPSTRFSPALPPCFLCPLSSQLEAAIAAQTAELERIKEAQRVRRAALCMPRRAVHATLCHALLRRAAPCMPRCASVCMSALR